MGAWDDIGFRGIDSKVSEEMKKQLSRKSSRDFERELPSYTLRRAEQIVDLKFDSHSEHISQKELLRIMKDLRNIGYPVSGYSNMCSGELYGYFHRIQKDIRGQFSRLERSS